MRVLDGSATPHTLVLGASGQGKSSLLGNIADRAGQDGHQVFVADNADGALADQIAAAARGRGQLVSVYDFGADHRAASMLPTQAPPGVEPAEWANTLYEILRDLWDGIPAEYFGPVAERCLRLTLAALVRDPAGPHPLTVAPRLLDPSEVGFRDGLLNRIDDDELTRGFQREILPMLTTREPGNALVWLISKLEPLIGSPVMQRALSGNRSGVALEQAIAEGASIAIKAPASVLGDAGGRIVIAILLHRTWLALRRQAGAMGSTTIVLDEWQRYSTPTIATMLAEGRKCRVRLVLANQNLAQLNVRVRDTALGNVGTIACFRTGPSDAFLLREIFRTVTPRQLQALPRHHVAIVSETEEVVGHAPTPLPDVPRVMPHPVPPAVGTPTARRPKTRVARHDVLPSATQPDS
jgi:hypothetical protein